MNVEIRDVDRHVAGRIEQRRQREVGLLVDEEVELAAQPRAVESLGELDTEGVVHHACTLRGRGEPRQWWNEWVEVSRTAPVGTTTSRWPRTRGPDCPVCGKGVLADIAYDAAARAEPAPEQQPTSRQLDTYTCGHQVPGARLEAADDRLDVERRTSEEAAEPRPEPDG